MRTKQTFTHRVLATLMALVMVLGVLPGAAFAQPAQATAGTAVVTMLHETKDQPSMCNGLFAETADLELHGEEVSIRILVANPVPAFPDEGADGTVKNFTVTYAGTVYPAVSDMETKPMMVARETNALFGLTQGQEVPAQVLTVTLPKQALEEATLVTNAFVNVVMNTDVAFRMELTNVTFPEPEAPGFAFGTAQTLLTPGKYELPVKLMNASNVEKPSMAASCIQGGTLEVLDNGDAFVNVALGPVTVSILTGWSSQWEVYQEANTTSATVPAQVVETDEKGNETAIRFQLPNPDQDGAYVKMFVSLMGMHPDGFLHMDFAQAKKLEAPKTGHAALTMLHETKDQPSMCNGLFAETADLELHGDEVSIRILVANPVPAFPDEGADGTVKNFTVTYADTVYPAVSDMETKPMMVARETSPLFGLTQGQEVPAQVLTVTLPKQALEEPALVTNAFVNVVMNTDVVFRMELKDVTFEGSEVPAYPFGTAQTMLNPGKYVLPVKLMNAGNVEKPSMAASCILGGTLEVLDNGDAFVNVTLGPVTVGAMTGWASQWKIYQKFDVTSDLLPAEVVAKDGENHETEIRFQLPFTDQDGVFATMFVELMGMNPDGFLQMDFANAVPEGETPAPAAPVIAPDSQEFRPGTTVEVTITGDGEIRYTLDGTEPTADSTLYAGPISISKTTTVKAVAIRNGKLSPVAEATYTQMVPEIRTGMADVSFGSEKAYDVTAEVHILEGKIDQVVLSHNAQESGHASSASYADSAKAMAEGFVGLTVTDKQGIEAVDTVSGATITSASYRDAVLNALELNVPADLTFGSANIALEPGVYTVPIALRHADKHENASNAATAFPAVATLTVSEDGTAVLESAMQPVTIGPITDMAYDVNYYKEDNYTSEKFPVTVLETTQKPEPMPGAGKEVPTRISFVIPNNDFDGVYMQFTVDAMGPGYPDAWMEISYAEAKVPGTVEHFPGSAKVNQFGKYTIFTDVSVQDGVITNVAVTADDFISETHKPTNLMKIDQVTKALKDTWNGMAPTQENAEQIFKAIMDPQSPDDVIDSVSGATYSARAVRDAVMNAFDLTYQDEIINVPESVEPGVYEVEIGYYSDVVWHSLIEDVKNKATLTVYPDQSMVLDFDTLSGTDKEPLYILGFNGVYLNNDRTQPLTLEGCKTVMGLSSNDYEDEFFAKGTQVVNHLTFPLLGGMQKIYNTNAYLYVPAMKALNGDLSGVQFENGHFHVDIFAKIYWDSRVKVGEAPAPEGDLEQLVQEAEAAKAAAEAAKTAAEEAQAKAEAAQAAAEEAANSAAADKAAAEAAQKKAEAAKAAAETAKTAAEEAQKAAEAAQEAAEASNLAAAEEARKAAEEAAKAAQDAEAAAESARKAAEAQNAAQAAQLAAEEAQKVAQQAKADAEAAKAAAEEAANSTASDKASAEQAMKEAQDAQKAAEEARKAAENAQAAAETAKEAAEASNEAAAKAAQEAAKSAQQAAEYFQEITEMKAQMAQYLEDAQAAKEAAEEAQKAAEAAALACAKYYALNVLSDYADPQDYREAQQVLLEAAIAHGVETIHAAETPEAVEAALAEAQAVIDEIPTREELELPFVDVDEDDWYESAVRFVLDRGLFNGMSETHFGPEVTMDRAMLVTVLYRLAGSPAVEGTLPFTDVSESDYYTDALVWAVENDIIHGMTPTLFAPKAPVVREQMVTMLYRYAQYVGLDVTASMELTEFQDADSISTYAVVPMQWAVENGLITGMGHNLLSPRTESTRAQVATVLMRFAK